jgi:hypothetical protein
LGGSAPVRRQGAPSPRLTCPHAAPAPCPHAAPAPCPHAAPAPWALPELSGPGTAGDASRRRRRGPRGRRRR